MSKPRVYSDNSLRVMERFFQAFEICQKMKLIGSVTEFCKVQGIDKAHFYTQRKDPSKGFFQVGWIVPLIEVCNISALWIMTGRGEIFRNEKKDGEPA